MCGQNLSYSYIFRLIFLSGKNERQKVFHSRPEEVVEKYEMKITYDLDGDGFIETDEGELKQKVAVWTYLPDRTMIKSWEK